MHRPSLALAGVLLAFLTFGGQFAVIRHGIEAGLSVHDIIAIRFAVSGLALMPLILRAGIADLGGVGWGRGGVLTLLAGAPYLLVLVTGIALSGASKGAVLNPGLVTASGLVLSVALLGERLDGRRILAALLVLGGLVLVAWRTTLEGGGSILAGDVLIALTGVAWALYTVLLKRWSVPPLLGVAAVCCLSLAYLPVYGVVLEPGLARVPLVEILLQAVYQGLVISLLSQALYVNAVRVLGAVTISLMSPLTPILGTLLAYLILGERLSPLQWAGVGLVSVGMLSLAIGRR
jgi:drug/metabolite transporter (DMT)-like permease